MSRIFTAGSIVIHGIVIAGVVVAQLVALDDAMPMPRQPLTFAGARLITLTDLPLPAPRRSATGESTNPVSAGAPLVAPLGIMPETGLEDGPAPASDGPAIVGIEGGTGTIDLGALERVAPPPPAPPAQPVHLHAGIQAPRKTVDAAPTYPALARMTRVEGTVILEAVIDTRGFVESVHVLRSIQLLDQAAVDAVRHWRFTPALLNGEPVPVVMTVTVNFSLQNR